MQHPEDAELQHARVVAFRAQPSLMQSIEQAAANEGVSIADIARRAVMRDLRTSALPTANGAAANG